MPTDDYTRFIGTLPYASELFGVYRPLIGWNSQRKRSRAQRIQRGGLWPLLSSALIPSYRPEVELTWFERGQFEVQRIEPGQLMTRASLRPSFESLLMDEIGRAMDSAFGPGQPPPPGEWDAVLEEGRLVEMLSGPVQEWWRATAEDFYVQAHDQPRAPDEDDQARARRIDTEVAALHASVEKALARESSVAGMLMDLNRHGSTALLETLFVRPADRVDQPQIAPFLALLNRRHTDPFSEFDPTIGLPGVSVSPVGIVHMFRQYFFEFDTFLGTPVAHVWLSPGSSVELIESSTRKATVERTVTTESETRIQSERSTREQDEISEAVKQENQDDSKLGFSTTATQSWGIGSATATASLSLDATQRLAREDTRKRMREQSEKVSTEIRQLYKSTFKTVTETTDVSSKRYVLANDSGALVNYEMRRKMRQVGIQVQDVGTYLCWETFVDEPGAQLGLADLVHIAKPADLAPLPNQDEVPDPPDLRREFELTVTFSVPDRMRNGFDGFVPLGKHTYTIKSEPGYQLKEPPGARIELIIRSVSGEDSQNFRNPFVGILEDEQHLRVGVVGLAHGGKTLYWPHLITVNLVGTVTLTPTDDKKKEVAAANKKIQDDTRAATYAQQRAHEAAFHAAAKERLEQASAVVPRHFADLREEERTVVYRALIRDLMAKDLTTPNPNDDNYDTADVERRHVYSTVLNAIFDIDKMLYFVAPEWWKPRRHAGQYLGRAPTTLSALGKKTIAYSPFPSTMISNWSDNERRVDNYYISAKSLPARLGSSLGWVLQLDGDDNRNRFLNAPWVRAVIPIRPGKEKAALAWLQKADVEGADGLGSTYGETADHDEIRTGLTDAGLSVSDPPTVGDALRYLCLKVEEKHAESMKIALFPDRAGVLDEDKVWAVPVDKVYEHGFYPLERSFRAWPHEQPADTESSRNFQCMAQWVEILPTDQVVPVAVSYDPTSGRQI